MIASTAYAALVAILLLGFGALADACRGLAEVASRNNSRHLLGDSGGWTEGGEGGETLRLSARAFPW